MIKQGGGRIISWMRRSRWAVWRARQRLPASSGSAASYLTATTIFADGGIMQNSVGLQWSWPFQPRVRCAIERAQSVGGAG
jgi:hypothetical protein